MNNYYLKTIILENCPYSIAANNLLKNFNINHKSIIINQYEKDNYKTSNIETYPQIYLNKYNSKDNLLLGGYSDLKYVFDLFKNKKYLNQNVNLFLKKYNWWSKKAVLRLVQLINST